MKNSVRSRNCADCVFAMSLTGETKTVIFCRRYPPTVISDNHAALYQRTAWPEVQAEDWRGEFAHGKSLGR